jgi:hypothetical protein
MKPIKYNDGKALEGVLSPISGSINEIVFQKNNHVRIKVSRPKRVRNKEG